MIIQLFSLKFQEIELQVKSFIEKFNIFRLLLFFLHNNTY